MFFRTNQEQRVNAIGNARAVEVWGISRVDRPNIEAAAREGYLDALSARGFSCHYDDAPAPWQRNYEIGRLWACGMRACGIAPPDWSDDQKQVPYDISEAVKVIASRIGALRPEIEGMKEPDPALPILHEPLRIPRRILRRVK